MPASSPAASSVSFRKWDEKEWCWTFACFTAVSGYEGHLANILKKAVDTRSVVFMLVLLCFRQKLGYFLFAQRVKSFVFFFHRCKNNWATAPSAIPFSVDIKQLFDKVIVISGIIKVEVSFISRAEGRGW